MTESFFIGALTALYGISGVISLIAYFPTVKDLWKGIPSANFITYFLWFVYYLISVLYGIFVLKDSIFIVVSGLDTLILFLIVILIVRVQRGEIVAQVKNKQKKVVEKIKSIRKKKSE